MSSLFIIPIFNNLYNFHISVSINESKTIKRKIIETSDEPNKKYLKLKKENA